ncbi:hypothetical protein V8G54_005417 [Vigna mungo]|uniref:Uncharacterized protein n=1 Tax=Vigna mungo TaxID=3915 RepID=A0AAQ3NY98_VIGMU
MELEMSIYREGHWVNLEWEDNESKKNGRRGFHGMSEDLMKDDGGFVSVNRGVRSLASRSDWVKNALGWKAAVTDIASQTEGTHGLLESNFCFASIFLDARKGNIEVFMLGKLIHEHDQSLSTRRLTSAASNTFSGEGEVVLLFSNFGSADRDGVVWSVNREFSFCGVESSLSLSPAKVHHYRLRIGKTTSKRYSPLMYNQWQKPWWTGALSRNGNLIACRGREAMSGGSNKTHLHNVWVRSSASLQCAWRWLGASLGDLGFPFWIFVFSFFDSTLQRIFVYEIWNLGILESGSYNWGFPWVFGSANWVARFRGESVDFVDERETVWHNGV